MTTLTDLLTMHRDFVTHLIESGGELTPDIEAKMREFQEQFPAKVDSYASLDDRLENEAAYFKKMEVEIADKRKAIENFRKNLKERVKMAFNSLDVKELEGEFFKYTLSRSKPSLVIDSHLIEDKYKKTVISTEVDKKMIEEDLRIGVEVAGAKFVETTSLRRTLKTKANK